MSMTVNTASPEETENAGAALGKMLRGGEVIALFGGLGAGKTAFVRGLAKGMGIKERVTSPTFAIVNEYGDEPRLCHFDMYRIGSVSELENIGWYDYLSSGAVCAVEWSENIEAALPDGTIRVKITAPGGENRRIIEITGI